MRPGQSEFGVKDKNSELIFPLWQLVLLVAVLIVVLSIAQFALGDYMARVLHWLRNSPRIAERAALAWRDAWFIARLAALIVPTVAYAVASLMNLFDSSFPGTMTQHAVPFAPRWLNRMAGIETDAEPVEIPQVSNFAGSAPSVDDLTRHNIDLSILAKAGPGVYHRGEISATWAVFEKLRTAFINGASISVRDLKRCGHMTKDEARDLSAQLSKKEHAALWGETDGNKKFPSAPFRSAIINREWAPHPTEGALE